MKQRNQLLCGLLFLAIPSIAQQIYFAEERKDKCIEEELVGNGKLYAAFFQQQAAEYDALCLQAFNIARMRLDEALAQKSDKPLAIVSDIDETFLNTSYYTVMCGKKGTEYHQDTWKAWTDKAEATPLAGALEFYQYAHERGVAIFYVTNRKESERVGTALNIKRYNFPYQGEDHLIFRTTDKSKESRREKIAQKYNIVLLLGDNLGDFDKDFDKHTTQERAEAVQKNRTAFGKKYIVLPNTSYGDWESAAYGSKYLSIKERNAIILQRLKDKPDVN